MKGTEHIGGIAATLAFLFLAGFVLLVTPQPPLGYELNIYAHIPVIAWVFFGFSLLGAVLLILKAVFLDKEDWRRSGILGFLLLYLSMISLVMLPVFRGYLNYGRGDGLAHLGFVQDTLRSGNFLTDDIYPARELIVANLSLFSAISPMFLELTIPGIAPMLGLPFFYLLARVTLGSSRQALLGMLILSTTTLGITNSRFAPQDLGNLITVFFLFLYLRFRWESSAGGRALLVLMGLCLPIIHPFTATIIILCLVVMEIVLAVVRYRPQPSYIVSPPLSSISLGLAIMITVVYVLWSMYHTYLLGTLSSTIEYMLGKGIPQSLFEEYFIQLAKYKVNLYSIVAKMYGHTIYYGIIALVGAIIFVRRFSTKDSGGRNKLMLLAFAVVPFSITILQTFSEIWRVHPGRAAVLVEVAFPVFAAVALMRIFKNRLRLPLTGKRIAPFSILAIALLAPMASVVMFDAHLTPLRQWPGEQVTRQEYRGLGWFFAQKDESLGIKEIGIRHFRFASLYPKAVASGWYGSPELEVKDHFGYNFYVQMGEALERDSYVLTSEYDWQVQTVLFAYLDRFSAGDFRKLDDDPSVSKLYTATREMEVRYVRALARY
ncbi:MAG: hypothetical protein HY671_06055 [Chloroflexi bacterium]|nr:hypothetical protein [Chloroflexota bacterium]